MATAIAVTGVRTAGGLQLAQPGGSPTGSWLEAIQYLLLVACITVFAWVAARDRLRRPMALAFVTLLTLALVRELHVALDRLVAHNFWQALAALLTVIAGVYEYRHRHRLVVGWERSQPSTGLGILLTGFMLLVPFVQILSWPELWAATLDVPDPAGSARVFKELAEIGAYLIVLIGSLEFLHGWSRLPQTREMDRRRPRRRGG